MELESLDKYYKSLYVLCLFIRVLWAICYSEEMEDENTYTFYSEVQTEQNLVQMLLFNWPKKLRWDSDSLY